MTDYNNPQKFVFKIDLSNLKKDKDSDSEEENGKDEKDEMVVDSNTFTVEIWE